MAINLLTSLIYEVVQQSWLVSTVLVKYILIFTAIESYRDKGLDLDNYRELILSNSEQIVTIMVFLGVLNSIIRIEFNPVLKIFSEFITVIFFGYLFWKY